MASPVSIGDALLLAKLALKLGRAFTKGRKSAPDEFREVENQLYSLSAALSALSEARETASSALNIDLSRLPSSTRERQANGGDVLNLMLDNCQETLRHLEKLVEKYSSIRKSGDSGASVTKKWKKELRDTWKKVEWTTEGGDLATLRSQLAVHTNSLNLVLAVINHTKADSIEENISQVSVMLKEIHTWFVQNLRDHAAAPRPPTQGEGVLLIIQPPCPDICFKVYVQSSNASHLVCPKASLHPKWAGKGARAGGGQSPAPKQVFQCHCTSRDQPAGCHGDVLKRFALSPFSFAMRLAGKERAWMLYKALDGSTNKLVSLVITGVLATRITEFEDIFVATLGARTAKSLLHQNLETMIAYRTPSTVEGPSEARVLDLMADLQAIHNLVESVTLTMNGQTYTRNSIETIQLLHYKVVKQEDFSTHVVVHPVDVQPMASAELVIFYGNDGDAALRSQGDDVDRMIVKLMPRTLIGPYAGDCRVLLKDIECIGQNAKEAPTVLASVDVSFRLTNPESAREFIGKLQDMRMELFVMSLKAPLPDEKLLLRLQARGVHTEDLSIPESEINILQSTKTQRLRLIVKSNDRCTLISQEMAEDLLSAPGGRPNFKSPTYVVQVVGNGTLKVHLYKDGFEILEFSDVQMDRLVELGLAAVSGGSSLSGQTLLQLAEQ